MSGDGASSGALSSASTMAEDISSSLGKSVDRFLSAAVQHAFLIERRTPDDFLRHFPPDAIMAALAERPDLRARILSETTGVRVRIAERKSFESAGDDLRIALDAGETHAQTVVTCFAPDDRVRYLDAKKLWAFLIEGEYWNVGPKERVEGERARKHLAFLLDRALTEALASAREVVEGISVRELASVLPRSELERLIEGAFGRSHDGKPFTEAELLSITPPTILVEHVPLPVLWERVVAPLVAARHGLSAQEEARRSLAPSPVRTGGERAGEGRGTDAATRASVRASVRPASSGSVAAGTSTANAPAATAWSGPKSPDGAKAVDARSVDARARDAPAPDAKVADAKVADAKAPDTRAADTKAADPRAADPGAADTKAERVTAGRATDGPKRSAPSSNKPPHRAGGAREDDATQEVTTEAERARKLLTDDADFSDEHTNPGAFVDER